MASMDDEPNEPGAARMPLVEAEKCFEPADGDAEKRDANTSLLLDAPEACLRRMDNLCDSRITLLMDTCAMLPLRLVDAFLPADWGELD